MPILHVRKVPEDLYRRLEERARAERRSLSAEVITLLDRALERSQRSPAAVLASIRRRRRFSPGSVGAADSTALLREDRQR